MQKGLLLATLATSAVALLPPSHGDISMNSEIASTFRGENNSLLEADFRVGANPEQIARQAITSRLGKVDMVMTDSVYTKHNGMTHVYFQQEVNGLRVSNAHMNVNVNQLGQVVSMGSSAIDAAKLEGMGSSLLRQQISTEPITAIKSFLKYANLYDGPVVPTRVQNSLKGDFHTFTFTASDDVSRVLAVDEQTVEAQLMYTVDEQGELQLTWSVNIESEKPHYAMYQALMTAAKDGESTPLQVNDLVKWFAAPAKAVDGRYNAYTMPAIDPNLGERNGVNEAEDESFAPLGWHGTSADVRTTTTIGNNVIAQENFDGSSSYINNYRPSEPNNNHQYPIDFTQEPREYIDGALANLFYWNNMFHDVMYVYGWDEVAGNMQDDNFGRGGRGGDALQANAQDGAGYNNANQATPADGSRGRQRMYVWNQVRPMIDGDLDSGIIIHEYAHSLSTRLTGGPGSSGCLGNGQAGGMGEGWGDTIATFFQQTAETRSDERFPMGKYAAGRGIRQFDYSTDMSVNPDTYNDIGRGGRYNAVHASGAVWANTLMEVYWDMKDANGFEANWLNSKSTAGNIMLLQNIIDGMKMQPCTPTMLDARDAIMDADRVNYGGRNVCTMWKGFAKRGFGVDATTTGTGFGTTTNGFSVPRECQ